MKYLKRKLFKVKLMSVVMASIKLSNLGMTSYAIMPSDSETSELEVRDEDVGTELLRAVSNNEPAEVVQRLIQNGEDVNATDFGYMTEDGQCVHLYIDELAELLKKE